MAKQTQFDVGAKVQLKSSPGVMLMVTQADGMPLDGRYNHKCQWLDDRKHLQQAVFPGDVLEAFEVVMFPSLPPFIPTP